jgi:hypothetical protein
MTIGSALEMESMSENPESRSEHHPAAISVPPPSGNLSAFLQPSDGQASSHKQIPAAAIPPPPCSPGSRDPKAMQQNILQTFYCLTDAEQAAFVNTVNSQIAQTGGVPVEPANRKAVENAVIMTTRGAHPNIHHDNSGIPAPPQEYKPPRNPEPPLLAGVYHNPFESVSTSYLTVLDVANARSIKFGLHSSVAL